MHRKLTAHERVNANLTIYCVDTFAEIQNFLLISDIKIQPKDTIEPHRS